MSTIAGEGIARIVATGQAWGERDSGTIVCRKDFIDQEPRRREGLAQGRDRDPDVVLRPAQPRRGAEIAQKYVTGFTDKALWFSLAGLMPEPYYGGPIRDEKLFVWNDDVQRSAEAGA